MSSLERPIFVVGAPRSGTTLVQCILSANSQAYSLPETHFFSIVLPALGMGVDTRLLSAELARARDALATDAELVAPLTLLGATPRELLISLFEAYRPDATRTRVVEKTPLHVEHLPTIAATFPDAVFVNIVRNPADVVSSWLRVPFASTRSVISCAQSWSSAVAAAEAFGGRTITLIYERLVREPEATVRTLCSFLGLEFEQRMLDEFGREAARNVGTNEAWKADVARGQILNRDQIWRQRLTRARPGWWSAQPSPAGEVRLRGPGASDTRVHRGGVGVGSAGAV